MAPNSIQLAAAELFPEIEPYRTGHLEVDGGHALYFEESGNAGGIPALFLHGGPGSRTRAAHRRFFDPRHYRIVLCDQRGCGLSSPAGRVESNTTQHLVADIERLRLHLGVGRWMLFGGSWGSALALAYAQAHPDRVTGLVLRGVFLASRDELQWYLGGMRKFIPEAWAEFAGAEPHGLLARYRALVDHADPGVALAAARSWNAYEARMMAMSDALVDAGSPPAEELLARVRVQLHYLAQDCFLRENELLDNLWRIGDTPAIIVQGRMDMVCPPQAALSVAQGLPGAELHMVPGGGHSASQPAMAAALSAATIRMQERLRA